MSKPRVTIYVRGGIADYAADPGIDVEMIDFDDIAGECGVRDHSRLDDPDDYDAQGHPGPALRAWIDAHATRTARRA